MLVWINVAVEISEMRQAAATSNLKMYACLIFAAKFKVNQSDSVSYTFI